MNSEKDAENRPQLPTSDEFLRTLGQVTWLMTMSRSHRGKPISLIEAHVSASLMFKQVRVFTKGAQPIAAVLWAYASSEVKVKIEKGGYVMKLEDWRSGSKIVVVDCISPLMDPQVFIDQFTTQVEDAQTKS